jgi:hypothetical protein
MEAVCNCVKTMCDFANPDYIDCCDDIKIKTSDDNNFTSHELANYICMELQSRLGDDVSSICENIIDEKVMITFIYKETCCEISDSYDYDGSYFRIIFS